MRLPRPHPSGFTLLEILIVLTMIGILAAVTIPAIADRSRSFEIVEQARRVHTEVSKLRGRAVAEQREYELVLSGGDTIKIQRKDAGGTKTVTRSETLPADATAKLNGASSGTVTFYPTGRVDVTGELAIYGSKSTHKVKILASGMTRWETE